MTLPASGSITTAQIRTEIGGSGAVVIPSTEVRTLTGVASGPVVLPNDFWGKSSLSPAPSGTVLYDSSTPGAWSYTHSAYATQNVTVEVWGGGGGGALNSTGGKTPTFYAGGGAGAGYSSETYSLANGASLSGTVGSPGAYGGSLNVAGTSGTATSCSQTGQTANGGGGAPAPAANSTGGTASGGTTNSTGEDGVAAVSGSGFEYGGASPNGGARKTSSGTGNYPGGGGLVGNGASARVLIRAA